MMELLDLLFELGRWSLDGFWIPLAAWTAVALPAYAVVKLVDGSSPYVRYWTLVALLLSLPLGIAASWLALYPATSEPGMAIVTLPLSLVVEPNRPDVFVWTSWHTAGLALILTALVASWRTGSLFSALRAIGRYRRSGTAGSPDWVARESRRIGALVGLTRPVKVCVYPCASPFTFGLTRPVIVIPADLLDDRDSVRIALTHEFIHVRRRDYLLQMIEQVIAAVFAVHPLVALIRRDTSVLREITCDADVIAQTGARSAYARLLYRYATVRWTEPDIAVGIFSRRHQLHTRIRAMKRFFDAHSLRRSKKAGMLAFALLLVVAVVAVACSDLLVESTSDLAADSPVEMERGDTDTFVVVEEMPELIGGLESIQENLRYPELARNAGIEGRVIVQFVVDEEGRVVDPVVVRGLGSGLDAAALEAVRTAEFEPGRQHGEPVKVKMSIPITFVLGDDASSEQPATSSSLWIRDIDRSNGVLRGTVVDLATDMPVAGVNVSLPGTNIGAATDEAGRFAVSVPEQIESRGLLRLTRSNYQANEINYRLAQTDGSSGSSAPDISR